jgi:hypothetical protein
MTARRISIKMFFARRKTHLPHEGDLGKPCVDSARAIKLTSYVMFVKHAHYASNQQ